jgi:heat shock protein HslJ
MRIRVRERSLQIVAGLLSVVVFVACGAHEDAAPRTESGDANLEGAWELVAGTGPAGDVEVVDLNRITLIFRDDFGGGSAGCNDYGAGNWVDGEGFDFENSAMTAMGCAPRVMAAEDAYTEALGDVEQATRTSDRLVLKGPASELVFALNEPVSTEGLLDRTWILVETAADGRTAPAIGEPTTFRMGSGGSVEWSGPCGSASGTWDRSGDEISIPSWRRDSDPPCARELEKQASTVSAAFGGAFRPRVNGDRLEISSAGSSARAIYRAG